MDQEISIKGYILILNSLMQKSDQWGKSAMKKTVYLALPSVVNTLKDLGSHLLPLQTTLIATFSGANWAVCI